MFYCPKCECKVYPEVSIKNIQADYSVNLFTSYINLALCSLGNFQNLDVTGYRCPRCSREFDTNSLYLKSQLSNRIDKMENFIIVSIRNKKEEYVDGRVVLIIPPKIIHESELDIYKSNFNPYNDDKYIIINKLSKITISTPR